MIIRKILCILVMVGVLIRSHCKKRMHEETNEEEKDKLEEKMSPQLTISRPVPVLLQDLAKC